MERGSPREQPGRQPAALGAAVHGPLGPWRYLDVKRSFQRGPLEKSSRGESPFALPSESSVPGRRSVQRAPHFACSCCSGHRPRGAGQRGPTMRQGLVASLTLGHQGADRRRGSVGPVGTVGPRSLREAPRRRRERRRESRSGGRRPRIAAPPPPGAPARPGQGQCQCAGGVAAARPRTGLGGAGGPAADRRRLCGRSRRRSRRRSRWRAPCRVRTPRPAPRAGASRARLHLSERVRPVSDTGLLTRSLHRSQLKGRAAFNPFPVERTKCDLPPARISCHRNSLFEAEAGLTGFQREHKMQKLSSQLFLNSATLLPA